MRLFPPRPPYEGRMSPILRRPKQPKLSPFPGFQPRMPGRPGPQVPGYPPIQPHNPNLGPYPGGQPPLVDPLGSVGGGQPRPPMIDPPGGIAGGVGGKSGLGQPLGQPLVDPFGSIGGPQSPRPNAPMPMVRPGNFPPRPTPGAPDVQYMGTTLPEMRRKVAELTMAQMIARLGKHLKTHAASWNR